MAEREPHALWALREIMGASAQAQQAAVAGGVAPIMGRQLLSLQHSRSEGVPCDAGERGALYAATLIVWVRSRTPGFAPAPVPRAYLVTFFFPVQPEP